MKRFGFWVTIVGLVVAIIVVGSIVSQRESINHDRATLPPIVTATASATATAALSSSVPQTTTAQPSTVTPVTTSASVSSSASEQAPQPSVIQPIAPAEPIALHIHEPGIDLDAIVAPMPFNKNLTPVACVDIPDDVNCPNTAFFVTDPPGVETLGVAPGYPTTDSTYILGHAYSEGTRVFSRLSELILSGVDLRGYRFTLDTANGSITYEIRDVGESPKKEIGQAKRIWDVEPNYAKLIMCALTKDFNLMVYAEVVATHPN